MGNIPDIIQQRLSESSFRSKPIYDQVSTKVDRENGIIYGVQIIREGEAKGHGISLPNGGEYEYHPLMLDMFFLEKIVGFGSQHKNGTKSRYNHPNMSVGAFGTMIGRFYDYRIEGKAAYADLHLSEAAKTSPNGNLYEYVLDMAENESEHFGNSIHFSDDGNLYVKNKKGERRRVEFRMKGWDSIEILVEEGDDLVLWNEKDYSFEFYNIPVTLHASDLVDDPAATDGLFSAQLNSKAFAVQITNFLDANPEIWGFVEKHPDKLQPFLEKYRAYCERKALNTKPKMKKKPSLFQRLFSAFKTGGTFDITVTDTEGNQLSIITDSDTPAIGDEVTVVDESGETQPAADGNYVVADGDLEGQTITVAEGQIADITDPAADEEEQQPADVAPQEVSMAALQQRITELEAENKALKERPAAVHTELDEEEDFTNTSSKKKEYSFNEAGKEAYSRGKRAASRK